jgi:hypothetical protein
MRVLRCTNKKCESHEMQSHSFDVTITVDDDGDGNSKEIDGQYHTCCHCQEQAEWVNLSTECVAGATECVAGATECVPTYTPIYTQH